MNVESFYFEGKPIDVLLVEDSAGDIRLTQEALKDSKLTLNLHIAQDGMEAMTFLRREDNYANVPRPDLILLDLNLPKKDGREVLKEIKADDELKSIPVVILTISRAEEDVLECYDSYANCYITKPVDMKQFSTVVQTIEDFWFTIVKLPTRN